MLESLYRITVVGVYTWMNGIHANVTFRGGEISFEEPLFFPEKDFRREYHGAVKEGYIM